MIKLNIGDTKDIVFSIVENGAPKTGLTPTFSIFKQVSDMSDVPQPTISEIGGGGYKFSFTIPAKDDFYALIDTGLEAVVGTEKYIPILIMANEGLVFYATENGLPKTGLTPTITGLWQTDGTAVSPLPTAAELSNGFYKLTGFSPTSGIDYYGRVDTGVSDSNERYIPFAWISGHGPVITNLVSLAVSRGPQTIQAEKQLQLALQERAPLAATVEKTHRIAVGRTTLIVKAEG